MRLIDADAFEKFIEEKYKDGESTGDIKDQMLFDLSYQPTAYSVAKVLAELEEMKSKPTELCYDVPLINSIIGIVKRNGRKE